MDGIAVLNATYTRGEENVTFRRRAYWLLQPYIDARLQAADDSRRDAEQDLLSLPPPLPHIYF